MAIDFIPRQFDVDRQGVPTDYGGTHFRSRLEAKWAAFFDLVKWPWTYEPTDLAGYIPDFALRFPHGTVIAEVKPALELVELREAALKLCLSGCRRDYLLLGAIVEWQPETSVAAFPSIGLYDYLQNVDGELEWIGSDHAEAHRCLACRAISVHHASGKWHCMVCGAYDGAHFIGALKPGEIQALWREAGNRTQWRGDSAHGAQVNW